MATALSGLVVLVPDADPVVGPHRLRLDPIARLGVPAHVTVLFPFVPPAAIDDDVLRRVASVVRETPAFEHRFSRTDWFGDAVLWLAPDDPAPFRGLTERVTAAFPDHPPYGGAFDDVVPHLTVGDRQDRTVLAAAEADLLPRLPVVGRTTEVTLLAQHRPGGPWSPRAAFPLGD